MNLASKLSTKTFGKMKDQLSFTTFDSKRGWDYSYLKAYFLTAQKIVKL